MTPEEFRAARVAAALSVRKAAQVLGVSPSTIQRWEMGDSRIPADAAERIRELAADRSATPGMARALGRLFAVLEMSLGEPIPQSITTLVQAEPLAALGALMRLVRHDEVSERVRARLAAHEDEIAEISQDISPDLSTLSAQAYGAFWLGYYARKNEQGSKGVQP